jgi:hypothetical protein
MSWADTTLPSDRIFNNSIPFGCDSAAAALIYRFETVFSSQPHFVAHRHDAKQKTGYNPPFGTTNGAQARSDNLIMNISKVGSKASCCLHSFFGLLIPFNRKGLNKSDHVQKK